VKSDYLSTLGWVVAGNTAADEVCEHHSTRQGDPRHCSMLARESKTGFPDVMNLGAVGCVDAEARVA